MPLRSVAGGGFAWPILAIVVAIAPNGPAGIEVDIDSRAIDQAVSIARERRDAVVGAFNDRYVLAPTDPRLERMEIITEFRRVVLMGRERIAAGNFTWTAYEMTRLLEPFRGRLSILAHVRFPPQHVIVTVPDYTAILSSAPPGPAGDASDSMRTLDIRTSPYYAPGFNNESSVMVGARVEADFDARALDPNGQYFITVYENKTRLAPVAVNLEEVR
jgi:hypothetical protein